MKQSVSTVLGHPITRFLSFSFLVGSAAAGLLLLSGCALVNEVWPPGDLAIPIRAVEAEGGVISGPVASEVNGRLLVTGSVIRIFGPGFPAPSHVAVQLVDADGTVFAEKLDPLAAPRDGPQRDRYSFAVSFPLVEATKADWIVVRYHPKVHGS